MLYHGRLIDDSLRSFALRERLHMMLRWSLRVGEAIRRRMVLCLDGRNDASRRAPGLLVRRPALTLHFSRYEGTRVNVVSPSGFTATQSPRLRHELSRSTQSTGRSRGCFGADVGITKKQWRQLQ